jgi:ABC-2 type transport system ATP-binding protein/lipopolysaccharide transport system ATP-binding protein
MTTPAVRLIDVSKRFRIHSERRDSLKERAVRGKAASSEEFWALRDATFEVPRGSSFGILGHNGSGKSTTLKVLAGIYRPTSGTVEVNGRVSALLELGAGFHPELTGRENIQLNGAILGLSRQEIHAATDRIIDFAGIDQFIDMPVKIYSSGMYVRLGFAIAVSVRPEILVVDEVIAVGDEEFQRKCFDHLHQLRRDGSTVIIVSHSLGVLEELCDEAIWIDHGHIAARGEARPVVRQYLQSINENEAAARGQLDGMVRLGTGEVVVCDLQYLDADGNVQSHLITGEPARFRMKYSAHKALPRGVVGLGFYTENGVNLCGPNSSRQGLFAIERGDGVVEFSVEKLLLTPGNYQVSTAIAEDGSFIDIVDRGFSLKVRGSQGTEPGLTLMPGTWSLEETADAE